MIKPFIGTIFFLVLITSSFAQQIEVRDIVTGEFLPGAIVSLTNTENGEVRRAASDNDGLCFFRKSDTVQFVEVRMLGYRFYKDTISAGSLSKKCLLKISSDSLDAVVITAQYNETRPEDAVQSVKIIDRARIDAQGAQNLRELLTNEMNIRISQDPILGSGMTLQGLSGENVKIMIDGVPIIGRQNGNIDLSQITLANIERVEIIEGPQSVNYGTNALAGVINLITIKKQSHTFSVGSDNFYESSGHYNTLFRAGVQRKRNVFLLSTGRNYFDGWSASHAPFRYEHPAIADSNRVMEWKPREQYFGTIQFIRNVDRGQFGFNADVFSEKISNRGMPRLPYYETAFDDQYLTFRSTNTFYANLHLNDKHQLQVQAAYNYYQRRKNTWFKDLTTLEKQIVEDKSMQDTSAFALYMVRSTFIRSADSLRLSYEVGMDVEYETAKGVRIKDGYQTIGDYALFISAQYKLWPRLTIRPGLRWSYNTDYRSVPVPSVNSLFRINDKWKLRASYARGFRSPSLKELYFFFVDINHNINGNQNLLAEHSNNYSATLTWNFVKEKIKYRVDIGGFYNQVSNLITLSIIQGNEYSYVNIGLSKTTGASATFDIRSRAVQSGISFIYVGRSNQLTALDDIPGFSWSPELRYSLMWKEKKSSILTGIFYKYTGKMPQFIVDSQDNIVQSYTAMYMMADCTFGRRFINDKLLLELGCRNLFDVRSITSTTESGSVHSGGSGTSSIANGRNYFFRVQFRFDFNKKEQE